MTLKRRLAGFILMFAHAGCVQALDHRERMWNFRQAARSLTVVERDIELQG